jgi:hypothetical protein
MYPLFSHSVYRSFNTMSGLGEYRFGGRCKWQRTCKYMHPVVALPLDNESNYTQKGVDKTPKDVGTSEETTWRMRAGQDFIDYIVNSKKNAWGKRCARGSGRRSWITSSNLKNNTLGKSSSTVGYGKARKPSTTHITFTLCSGKEKINDASYYLIACYHNHSSIHYYVITF